MKYQPDARHGQRRIHPSTRVLIWRSLGALAGLALAVPVGLAALALWCGPA